MPKKFQFENVPNRLSEKQKIGFLSLFATKKKIKLAFSKTCRSCLLTFPDSQWRNLVYTELNQHLNKQTLPKCSDQLYNQFSTLSLETMSVYFKKEQEDLFVSVCVFYLYVYAWELIESTYIKEHRRVPFLLRALHGCNIQVEMEVQPLIFTQNHQ